MLACDYSQVQKLDISTKDTDGSEVSGNLILVPILISLDEATTLLLDYDPNSGTSPSVSDARPLARAILDALNKFIEEGG